MAYYPGPPPADLPGLVRFVRQEFEKIAAELKPTTLQLQPSYVAPAKPRDGLVVLADGVKWDPGSGAGYYGYRGGAWHLLG